MRTRAPFIEERTTEDLEQSLKDTRLAIACCAWETEWTKDLRAHAERVEAELQSRYQSALDPQEIEFEEAKRNGF